MLLFIFFLHTPPRARTVDFATEIRPILQQRCQPCHFAGGIMYERRPFDRPETIVKLGTKLFTRIKDEKPRELIRRFLAEQTATVKPARPKSGR
jgi:hypothetical protein